MNTKVMNRMIWRTPLRLFAKILSTALMVFLIYGMYYSAVYIYHEQSGLNDKFLSLS
jgi:hypothetical protein